MVDQDRDFSTCGPDLWGNIPPEKMKAGGREQRSSKETKHFQDVKHSAPGDGAMGNTLHTPRNSSPSHTDEKAAAGGRPLLPSPCSSCSQREMGSTQQLMSLLFLNVLIIPSSMTLSWVLLHDDDNSLSTVSFLFRSNHSLSLSASLVDN